MNDLQQSETQATVDNTETVENQQPVAAEQQQIQEPSAASNESSLQDLIAEDLRAEPCLQDFKDINSLAKSYVNAQKLIGKSIRIPSEDASPEAKADFYEKLKSLDDVVVKPLSDDPKEKEEFLNKLGRPESPDKYELEDVIKQEIADTIPNLKEELDQFKDIAHEIGLNKEQAKKLVDMRTQALEQTIEQSQIERQQSEAKLKELWGNDYENRLKIAKHTAEIYKEKYPAEIEALINSPAGNNPVFLNMLVELGKAYKEQGHVGMSKAKFGMSPDEAVAKIQEKKADRGFMKAYTDDMDPGHAKAVQELQELYKLANGS